MKALLFGIFLISAPFFAKAQSNNSTVFRFLDVTPSAYSAALGGNHAGLFNPDFSLYHTNPAYLSGSNTGDISASFVNYLADSRMGFLNTALKLDASQILGFGIRFMGYGDFQSLDEDGNNLGNFSAIDLALSGAYSYLISERWSVGGELNYIYSSYEQYKSSAVAGTAGLHYQNTEAHFSFGAVVKNLGTQLTTYNGLMEPLPLDISIGVAKKPVGFPAELSFTMRRLNHWDMRIFGEESKPAFIDNIVRHAVFGGQFFLSENFKFRLGYNHYLHELNKTSDNFDFAGMSLGVGFKVKEFIIDLSRNSYSKSGGVVLLSIKTKL